MIYDFAEYQLRAHKTALKLDKVTQITMAALGLAGETGELVDEIKKIVFHKKEYSRDKIIKEMGDVLWYLAELASAYDIPFEDVATTNIRKLQERHGDGFKNHEDQKR